MSSVMLAADSTAIEDRYAPDGGAAGAAREQTRVRSAPGPGSRCGTPLPGAARTGLRRGPALWALVSLPAWLLYMLRAIGLRLTRPAGTLAAAALALVCRRKLPSEPRPTRSSDSRRLLEQTTLVFSQQTNLYAFDAPGAGTLSVTLKDWAFPVPLHQLSASILFQDQSWSLTPCGPGRTRSGLLEPADLERRRLRCLRRRGGRHSSRPTGLSSEPIPWRSTSSRHRPCRCRRP